jgi:hypothetical protein
MTALPEARRKKFVPAHCVPIATESMPNWGINPGFAIAVAEFNRLAS